jgi:hypothetical protein
MKRTNRWTIWRETALPLPPEPASAISAEAFERPIRKKDLDGRALTGRTSKIGLC